LSWRCRLGEPGGSRWSCWQSWWRWSNSGPSRTGCRPGRNCGLSGSWPRLLRVEDITKGLIQTLPSRLVYEGRHKLAGGWDGGCGWTHPHSDLVLLLNLWLDDLLRPPSRCIDPLTFRLSSGDRRPGRKSYSDGGSSSHRCLASGWSCCPQRGRRPGRCHWLCPGP